MTFTPTPTPTPTPGPYKFGLLWPARHPRSVENRPLLGAKTLGIEVTDPELARLCGLGNIDPQHDGGGSALAAVEVALTHPLPPDDARLVTIRPDADAFGAMAVLNLRRQGVSLRGERLRRVRQIAKWDRFDLGSWSRWRAESQPIPRPARIRDLGGAPPSFAMLAALASDHRRPLQERVLATARFLFDGLPDPEAMAAASAYRDGLVRAWNAGEIAVEESPDPRIVLVLASHPGALRLGYRWAPVVLAEGLLEGRRKLTVAQFEPGWADFERLRKALSALEPGWGGSATILGSPQGHGTALPLDRVVAELRSCMSDRSG